MTEGGGGGGGGGGVSGYDVIFWVGSERGEGRGKKKREEKKRRGEEKEKGEKEVGSI